MKKCVQWFLFFPLVFWVFAIWADNLTVVTLPVADQTQAALFKVVPEAMRQALIKLSGNPAIPSNPSIRAALPQAKQLMQSFSYNAALADDATSPLTVTIQFDSQALNHLLAHINQPILTSNRPITLAWIVPPESADDMTHTPLASGDDSEIATAFQTAGDALGLPTILPAMDLDDQNFINTNTALPFDLEKLIAAVKRYHLTSLLAGNLSQAIDGTWQAQWMYLLNGKSHQWNAVAPTSLALVKAAMVHMGSVMSSELAVSVPKGPSRMISLQIEGVRGLDDYVVVMSDLKQIPIISHVTVSGVDGATMSLLATVQGNPTALATALQNNPDFLVIPEGSLTADQLQTQASYYQFKSSSSTPAS